MSDWKVVAIALVAWWILVRAWRRYSLLLVWMGMMMVSASIMAFLIWKMVQHLIGGMVW